jgi:hypothetical protein
MKISGTTNPQPGILIETVFVPLSELEELKLNIDRALNQVALVLGEAKKATEENCNSCGHSFPSNELIHGPDPYAQDICGEVIETALCQKCHSNSVLDI